MFPLIKYHYLVPELARPEAFVSKIEPIDEQMFIDAVKHLSEITPDDQVTAGISHAYGFWRTRMESLTFRSISDAFRCGRLRLRQTTATLFRG